MWHSKSCPRKAVGMAPEKGAGHSFMEWYLTVAVLLIGLGVVFLAAEFFFPTGGVLVVAAVGCFAVAVGLIALYGDTQETVAAVIALSVGLPVAGSVMFYGLRRMALKSAL